MSARRKGKEGEQEVVDLLKSWWCPIDEEAQFCRTPSSGGWATAQLRGAFKTAGDVMTTSKRWPFSVEVKRNEAWSLIALLDDKPSPVRAWWMQCVKAALQDKREPLLLFRHSREPWLAAVRLRFGFEMVQRGARSELISKFDDKLQGAFGFYLFGWHTFERLGPEAIEDIYLAIGGKKMKQGRRRIARRRGPR